MVPAENPGARASLSDRGTPRAPRLRVLLVLDRGESADGLTLQMQMQMQMEGYETRQAFDARSALESALELHPDVVLLDISLPGIDGFQLARRIRRNTDAIGRPVLIAMSPQSRDVVGPRAYEAGIDYYLAKPVDPDKLLELVASVAAEQRTRSVGGRRGGARR